MRSVFTALVRPFLAITLISLSTFTPAVAQIMETVTVGTAEITTPSNGMTAAEGPLVDSRSMNLGDANSTDVSTDCLDKIDIFTHSWIQNIDLSTVPPTLLDERDESQLAITDRGQLVSGTTSVSGGGMAANTTVSTQSESQLAGSGNYKGTATFSADWSGPATPITAEFIDTRLGWTMRLKATVEQPVQFSIDYTVTGGYFILRKDDEDPIELTGSGKIAGTLLQHLLISEPGDTTGWGSRFRGAISFNWELKCQESPLTMYDPWPELVTADGQIMVDPSALARSSRQVSGAAADGVTKVLLNYLAPTAGIVRFCLADGTAGEDGGIAQLRDEGRAQCITTQTNAMINPANNKNEDRAFAIYRVPENFNRGSDEEAPSRRITIEATFQPDSPQQENAAVTLTLVRPPIVLIHGLWSEGATWSLPLQEDQRWNITVEDYKYTNARDFEYNSRVPLSGIASALRKQRNAGIAVTQVDVIAHSMGGLLSRIHTDRYSKGRRNYNQGDINRLITLNTPHGGSQFGNMLEEIRKDNGICKATFETLGTIAEIAINMGAIDQGATRDLAVGSPALTQIPETDVPAHTFVGLGGSEVIKALNEVLDASDPSTIAMNALGKLLREHVKPLDGILSGLETSLAFVGFCANRTIDAQFFSTLFHGDGHDMIVPAKSQQGGLSEPATTISPAFDSIHIMVTGADSPYQAQLVHLLNRPVDDPMFATLPAPSSLNIPPQTVANETVIRAAQIMTGGLSITTPASGASVLPGETIAVSLLPETGVTIDRVILVGSDGVALDNAAPFDLNFTIPKAALGSFTLVALGANGTSLVTSQPIKLSVKTDSLLQSMHIVPEEMLLFAGGDNRPLHVFGHFDDGIDRSLTSATTGTTYTSSDSSIAAVTADGQVMPLAAGSAQITVENVGQSATVTVVVSGENMAPLAYAGTDQVVRVGEKVTLDGSGSLDLDDDTLSLAFEWTQLQGPAVVLQDANTEHPSFVAAIAGTYEFGLRVQDEAVSSEMDTVQVKTNATDTTGSGTIIVGSTQLAPGATTTINVDFNVTDSELRSLDATLSYDPSVLKATACTIPTGSPLSTANCDPTLHNDKIVITWATADHGFSGTESIKLTFEAVGDSGAMSPLTMDINAFGNETAGIPYTVQNGEIHLQSSPHSAVHTYLPFVMN